MGFIGMTKLSLPLRANASSQYYFAVYWRIEIQTTRWLLDFCASKATKLSVMMGSPSFCEVRGWEDG
jgi:hypothetical protein